MLFIKLTPDQKKVKKLERELVQLKVDQTMINKNIIDAVRDAHSVMNNLHQRIEMLEFGPHNHSIH